MPLNSLTFKGGDAFRKPYLFQCRHTRRFLRSSNCCCYRRPHSHYCHLRYQVALADPDQTCSSCMIPPPLCMCRSASPLCYEPLLQSSLFQTAMSALLTCFARAGHPWSASYALVNFEASSDPQRDRFVSSLPQERSAPSQLLLMQFEDTQLS